MLLETKSEQRLTAIAEKIRSIAGIMRSSPIYRTVQNGHEVKTLKLLAKHLDEARAELRRDRLAAISRHRRNHKW